MGALGFGRGFQRGSRGGFVGGRVMRRPSGWEVMVVVVRKWVRRDWVPSRARDKRVLFRELRGRERRAVVGGRGLGSVVVR